MFELAGRTQPAPGRIGQIAPAVLHPVIEVMVAPGDRVKAGQILVRLDDDEARAAVRAKKAAVTEFRGVDYWAGSLWGLPPRAPTEPGVRISRTRFVTSWLRCPSHGQAVLR